MKKISYFCYKLFKFMAKRLNSVVYLDPEPHIYIHRETGEQYTSVTTVLSSIEPEFETEKVAEAIAKLGTRHHNEIYHGMSKEQIIEYWQYLNDTANEYGTGVHELLEKYLFANKWLFPENDLERAVLNGYHDLNIDEGIEIYPERIMFSEEFKIAGTADLIIDVDDEFFDVGDWKSNKVINYYSDYGNKTLLPPFSHLQDCEYNVYSLQLSTYALMMEMETGKKCRHIWIGYFNKADLSFTKIPIMYMKHEARQLLMHHKYQTQLKN